MPEKYVMANGLRLAYNEFGCPDDPPVILIMGLGTQMIAWHESFCQQLADQNLRVIRFDNRDVGLSEKIESESNFNPIMLALRKRFGFKLDVPYTLEDMANDAIGLIDALDIQQAHWVGASMGGMIAQILCANHPSRSLSLSSIMSTTGNPELPQPSPRVSFQLISRPKPSDQEAYLKHAIQTWRMIGSPAYPASDEYLVERTLRSLNRSYSPRGYRHHMAAIIHSGDRRPILRRIRIPTAVIHGKQDVLVPVEGGIDTAKNIRDSKLHLIEGMGHDIPKELYARIIRIITDNIQETSRT